MRNLSVEIVIERAAGRLVDGAAERENEEAAAAEVKL